MANLLVTALFDLYPNTRKSDASSGRWSETHLSLDFRIECLRSLMDSGADIVVFAQSDIAGSLGSIPENVKLIPSILSDVATFQALAKIDPRPTLPTTRNDIKDTYEYISLMNSKFDFVCEAEKLFPGYSHYSWIDAGILKLCHDNGAGIASIREIAKIRCDRIITPSGYVGREVVAFPTTEPCWRFLGGLLVIPQPLLASFKSAFDDMLRRVVSAGVITWEVNVLAYVECEHPELFDRYGARHDQSILQIPDEFKASRA